MAVPHSQGEPKIALITCSIDLPPERDLGAIPAESCAKNQGNPRPIPLTLFVLVSLRDVSPQTFKKSRRSFSHRYNRQE
jgi:hypothetical protein